MSNPGFVERLHTAGLGRFASQLAALDRGSYRLVRDVDGDPHRGGGHRLGGQPDLGDDVAWPTWHDAPMSFVAQIALGDLPPLEHAPLPADGLLSFFYDASKTAWGLNPGDAGACTIMWQPPGTVLAPRALPDVLRRSARFAPMPLRAEVEITHVPGESAEIDTVALSNEEWFNYADVLDRTSGLRHRLLGHPDPVQGDMQRDCEMGATGLNTDALAANPDLRRHVLAEAINWRLLLQVDSESEIGMSWGDAGCLYFWMHHNALRRHEWHNAWAILQAT